MSAIDEQIDSWDESYDRQYDREPRYERRKMEPKRKAELEMVVGWNAIDHRTGEAKKKWHTIGNLWPNKNGGYNLQLFGPVALMPDMVIMIKPPTDWGNKPINAGRYPSPQNGTPHNAIPNMPSAHIAEMEDDLPF